MSILGKTVRILLIGLIFGVLMIGVATAVHAVPSIQWRTENVYYDDAGDLIIEGFFYNNGSRTVQWINNHKVQVFFRTRKHEWWLQAEAVFYDLNVNIRPGETSYWSLKITGVDVTYYEYWLVLWETDFRYL